MSSVTYGNVTIRAAKLVHYDATPVQLGSQYVCTKHSVTVSGVIGPALNSYTYGFSANAPAPAPGYLAPATFAAIRHTLAQPRGQLILEAAGFGFLSSPPTVLQAVNPVIPATARIAQAAALGGNAAAPAGAGIAGAPAAFRPVAPLTGTGQALAAVAGLLGAIGTATGVIQRQGGFIKYAVADVNNGPVCAKILALENIGDKLFFIQVTFSTWLRESDPNAKTIPTPGVDNPVPDNNAGLNLQPGGQLVPPDPPAKPSYKYSPLAAHEWDMMHTVDQDFFTTRIIVGRAVFRRDVLDANKLVPDQLRYWLGHPIPEGMRRQQVQVRQMADGLTYQYTIVDRDRVLRFDPNIFTRVEMTRSLDTTEKSLWDTMVGGGSFSSAVGVGALVAAGGLIAAGINQLAQGNTGGLGRALQVLFERNFGLLRPIPQNTHRIIGRFWAHPQKRQTNLVNQAERFMTDMFQDALQLANPSFTIPEGFPGAGTTINSPIQLATIKKHRTVDLSGKFVEIDWTVLGNLLTGAWEVFIAGFDQRNVAPPQPEPSPILTDPMRGTYLGGCVAQALREPTDAWRQPGDPAWVRDASVRRGFGGFFDDPPGTDGADPGGFVP